MTSDSLVDALTQSTLNGFSLPEIFFDFDDPLQTQKMEIASVTVFAEPCLADTNADGLITPADFNAWVLNFNAGC